MAFMSLFKEEREVDTFVLLFILVRLEDQCRPHVFEFIGSSQLSLTGRLEGGGTKPDQLNVVKR